MWQCGPEQRQRTAKRQGARTGKLSDHPALIFVYRLACELGEPDIDKLLDGLTAKKLIGWMDYYELEPFGYSRMDLGNAIRGRRQRPFKVADFMPKFGPRKKQDWREMKAQFKLFAALHNQQVKKNG